MQNRTEKLAELIQSIDDFRRGEIPGPGKSGVELDAAILLDTAHSALRRAKDYLCYHDGLPSLATKEEWEAADAS